jgi:hypothetical protein
VISSGSGATTTNPPPGTSTPDPCLADRIRPRQIGDGRARQNRLQTVIGILHAESHNSLLVVENPIPHSHSRRQSPPSEGTRSWHRAPALSTSPKATIAGGSSPMPRHRIGRRRRPDLGANRLS